ncbi:MAG TPA: hypothetical protein VGX25_01160 [Actinophytocola sp.]|uniref:hypothetical protein n=1 Tax=Actinophytocola sp. TaxID=1872138 RepID=UPI002DDD44EE|nr:hypothetical protein [Actinophytocola sp.]HEV2777984.1 hypothetical protein [Actinophytocola sp.]
MLILHRVSWLAFVFVVIAATIVAAPRYAVADTQACGDSVPLEEVAPGGSVIIVGWLQPCLRTTLSTVDVIANYTNTTSRELPLTVLDELDVNNPPAPMTRVSLGCTTVIGAHRTGSCTSRVPRNEFSGGLRGWAKAWGQVYEFDAPRAPFQTPVLFS